MANTNSNLATAQAAALLDRSSGLATIALVATNLILIQGQVTCPATPSTSDTLTLIPAELLPVGAVYDVANSWVYCETDPGTALTLDIGPDSNPDALADALALTVAGSAATGDGTSGPITGHTPFTRSGTMPAALADPLVITAQEAVRATVVTSTAVDATVIQFCIAFRKV
jgi:hypothetical protein